MLPQGISRRETLHRIAAAACAATRGRLDADEGALERRRPLDLKLSCSCLAFSDMSWDKALAEVKRLGFQYADLAMFENWAHISPSDLADPEGHARRISTVCTNLSIDPIAIHANFVLGDPKQFPGLTIADPAARKTILAQFERVVTCARAANIPLVSVMPGRFIDGVPRETSLKNACDLLTQMHALAARRGISLCFENHTNSIGQHPDDAMFLLDKVPGLRLDYDLSHVVCNEYSIDQTRPLMKHVGHVIVRNAVPTEYNAPLEDGELSYPIRPFFVALRQSKVNAFVSVGYYQPRDRDNIPGLKAILERENISVT